MKIKIGTRKSKLALWQAAHIASLLEEEGVVVEIISIETKGDKIVDRALSKIGSKGVFTEELEEMLRQGEIDIAVHSAKDVQSSLPDELPIIAFTEREECCDVLVSHKDVKLGDEIVIGTSSTRRVALLKHHYPGVSIVDIRGNLQTRFSKMEEGHCDAMILAYAGVHRMGLDQYIVEKLSIDQFIPPVGQGALAIQAAIDLSEEKHHTVRKVCNEEQTEKCLLAERAYLRTMEGGCSIPVFANATLSHDELTLVGGITSLDGTEIVEKQLTAPATDAEQLGEELANYVLNNRGREILNDILKVN